MPKSLCALAAVVALLGCGHHGHDVDAGPSLDAGVDAGSSVIQVLSVRDLGVLQQPASVTARDGAASALVGGRVLWTFGDTLMNHPAVDGMSYRTSTAAFGELDQPLAAEDALDDAGCPGEFLPFTSGELAYNEDGGPDQRIALWPGAPVDLGSEQLVPYEALYVNPGVLNYTTLGTGWARLEGAVATRDDGFLFSASEPSYGLSPLVFEGNLYVYACTADGTFATPCTLARAPVAQVHDRRAYTFWDGTGWSADLPAATPVFRGAPGDCSVQWNPHLGLFVLIHSGIFDNRIFAHTAPRPEGPWSDAVELFAGAPPPDGTSYDYAGKGHAELAPDGTRLIVTYARPLGGFDEEVRVVEVTLR